MSKKIHLFSDLQHFTDEKNLIEVKGNTVGECLNDLVKQYPRIGQILFDTDGKVLPHIFISINLQSAYPEELNKPIKDGDEIYVGLIIIGG